MNQVHLQGRIINTWTWRDDLFARLSITRDSWRPAKGRGNQQFDYVTVRFPGGVARGLSLGKGKTLTVHGWLQSRDYEETLEAWLKDAQKNGAESLPDVSDEQLGLTAKRVTTEVIAEHWEIHG